MLRSSAPELTYSRRLLRRLRPLFLGCVLVGAVPLPSPAQVNMLTYHNDNARTGQNLNETMLTRANVNTNSFGRLFSCDVDGDIYAQPLYVSNLAIPNRGTHHVVFVATEHDSVYAFDADDNRGSNAVPLWRASLINPAAGVTTVPGEAEYYVIMPEIGITSTPVIDLGSGAIYVDTATREAGPTGAPFVHRLHALDLGTGGEKFGGPVLVQASVSGTGLGNDGSGQVPFVGFWQLNRAGLLALNGVVYLAYASYADAGWFHGWVLAYDAQTLQLLGAFNTTPNGSEGGIWQSGAALAAGIDGDIYCLTGNGTFDPALDNYGDSFLKLALTGAGLEVADYFTPYNQQQMADFDGDLGSGGALVLPDSVGSPAHPHLLVGSGKEGTIYLVDRDNLGHFNPTNDSQIVQALSGAVISTFSLPAYFNNQLYYAAQGDFLKAFTFANGLLVSSPVSQSLSTFGFPGATPAVSANGANDGIVWVVQADTAPYGGRGTLHAYDAADLSRELYNSSQAAARDDPGGAIKFSVPTVANGKVYVSGASRLSVFGNASWVPAPTLNPNGGVFTNSVLVDLAVASPDAEVHYTLDGTAATPDSPRFIAPFTLTDSTVVRAIAVATNMLPSGEVTAFFASAPPAAAIAGFGGNAAGWTLNGGASATNDVLTLTDGLPGETGSAFFNTSQIITNFEARFIRRATVGASGAAFVVQNSTNGPSALSDGCLGYCGIGPSGAVIFDVETGFQGDAFTDTGYTANGNAGGYSSTLPLDLGAGNPIAVTLKYDGSVLTEHLADLNTGLTYDTNYVVNLASTVGGANTAFVGFTGATGSSASVQTIDSFTFGPYYPSSVVILSPRDGAVSSAPTDIAITVSASESDGRITNAQFFNGSLQLGQTSLAPYSFLWTNVAAGAYTLTAVTTDDQGETNVSSPVHIIVTPPSLTVSRVGNEITISWASPVDYVLEVTDSLSAPAVWTPAPEPHVVEQGQTIVGVAVGPGTRLYRLRAP